MIEGAYLMNVIRSRCTEEGDCLIWPGAMNAGTSPTITFRGKSINIRRWIWVQVGKSLPERGTIKVKCRESRCIAEGHMFAGTFGPTVGTRCTPALRAKMANLLQARSTLTWSDIEAIRLSDDSLEQLAARYGKAKKSIQNIRAGRTWKVTTGFFAGLGARQGAEA